MDDWIGRGYKDTQASKADLIRTLGALRSIAESRGLKSANDELSGLSEKLMVSRFHLAIVGQMKRGKSSVVNALLGAEVLPTGILPLTSVITRVRYSSSAGARIIYQSGHAEDIEAQLLDQYITEAKNPGNRKEVGSAEVYWPSPLLQLGIDLVDTPGIGSTHSHNTTTTERYLREIDAAVMVLSVDPPITAAESEFVRALRCEVPRLLFVLNKTDTVTAREVEDLLEFVKAEIRNRCGVAGAEVFPVSAREALEKIRSRTIEKPDRPGLVNASRKARRISQYQDIERVAILSERLRNKAVFAWIMNRRIEIPVQPKHMKLLVVFILVYAVQRNFNHRCHNFWGVFSHRQSQVVVAHRSPCCPASAQ